VKSTAAISADDKVDIPEYSTCDGKRASCRNYDPELDPKRHEHMSQYQRGRLDHKALTHTCRLRSVLGAVLLTTGRLVTKHSWPLTAPRRMCGPQRLPIPEESPHGCLRPQSAPTPVRQSGSPTVRQLDSQAVSILASWKPNISYLEA
jgi:hypothetical protein